MRAQWYAGKCLTIIVVVMAVENMGEPLFVVFANFCTVNTPIMTNVKLPM